MLDCLELLGVGICDLFLHANCEQYFEGLLLLNSQSLLFLFMLRLLLLAVDGILELFENDQHRLEVLYFGQHFAVQLNHPRILLRQLLNLILNLLNFVIHLPVIRLPQKISLFLQLKHTLHPRKIPKLLHILLQLFPLINNHLNVRLLDRTLGHLQLRLERLLGER